MLWPHVPDEYRRGTEGHCGGPESARHRLDIWDVVALNASMEWSYYTRNTINEHGIKPPDDGHAPEHCSAFVATGSYTKDGHVVDRA